MKAQGAPSRERMVQELDALPPRCHLWDKHLQNTRRVLYERREVSTPLDKDGRGLGPDNTHAVKALPPTSWHLTTVFSRIEKKKDTDL